MSFNGRASRQVAGSTRQIDVSRISITLILVVLLLSVCALAQRTTGTLRGQVLDPQNAVVPNAKVTASNEATGVVQTTVTTSAGTYVFPTLPPGQYSVKVDTPGFRESLNKSVQVASNTDNQSNFVLTLGTTSETIEVTAGGEGVQTTSAT